MMFCGKGMQRAGEALERHDRLLGDWVQVIKAGESDATRKAGSVMQCWNR